MEASSRYENFISDLSEVLQVHWSTTSTIASHLQWDLSEVCNHCFSEDNLTIQHVQGDWYSAEELVAVWGNPALRMVCFSCEEPRLSSDLVALSCGHLTCKNCWVEHIQQSLLDQEKYSQRMISILCPRNRTVVQDSETGHFCNFVCGADVLSRFISREQLLKYLQRLAR